MVCENRGRWEGHTSLGEKSTRERIMERIGMRTDHEILRQKKGVRIESQRDRAKQGVCQNEEDGKDISHGDTPPAMSNLLPTCKHKLIDLCISQRLCFPAHTSLSLYAQPIQASISHPKRLSLSPSVAGRAFVLR